MPRVRCGRCGARYMRHIPSHTLCAACFRWTRENGNAAKLESQATALLRGARAAAQGGGVRVPTRVLQNALRVIEGGLPPGESSKLRMKVMDDLRAAARAAITDNPATGVLVPRRTIDQVLRLLGGSINPSDQLRLRVGLANELRSVMEGRS